MIERMLAQGSGIDDWIQFIVVIAVIGLSVLGQISKTLIEKFSPKNGEGKGERKASRRPMPPGEMGTPPRPPVAKPAPPRTQRTFTPQPARPAAPRPLTPPVARPRAAAPRPPSATARKTSSPRPPVREKRPPAAASQPVPEDEASLRRRHLAHLASPLENEGEIVEAEVCDHISHIDGDLQPEADEISMIDDTGTFERPSRTALRRAVVLSEMLAPPLALRERTDRW